MPVDGSANHSDSRSRACQTPTSFQPSIGFTMCGCVGHEDRRRTVEEDDEWLADEPHGHTQLALVAARVGGGVAVGVLDQVHLLDLAVDHGLDLLLVQALDSRVQLQMLAARQQVELQQPDKRRHATPSEALMQTALGLPARKQNTQVESSPEACLADSPGRRTGGSSRPGGGPRQGSARCRSRPAAPRRPRAGTRPSGSTASSSGSHARQTRE